MCVVVRSTPRSRPSRARRPPPPNAFGIRDAVPRRLKKMDAFVQVEELGTLACGACDWSPRRGSGLSKEGRRGLVPCMTKHAPVLAPEGRAVSRPCTACGTAPSRRRRRRSCGTTITSTRRTAARCLRRWRGTPDPAERRARRRTTGRGRVSRFCAGTASGMQVTAVPAARCFMVCLRRRSVRCAIQIRWRRTSWPFASHSPRTWTGSMRMSCSRWWMHRMRMPRRRWRCFGAL